MAKRGKLDIMRDILKVVQDNGNSIKPTPLLRKSNLASARFKEYCDELVEKGFVKSSEAEKGKRYVVLTEKGLRFLEKYKVIVDFIDEFGL